MSCLIWTFLSLLFSGLREKRKEKKFELTQYSCRLGFFFLGRKKAVESTTNPQDKYFTKVLLKHLGKHRRGICLCSCWVPDLVYPNRLCIFFSHKTAFKTKIVIHLINSFSYVYIPFTSCVHSHFSFFFHLWARWGQLVTLATVEEHFQKFLNKSQKVSIFQKGGKYWWFISASRRMDPCAFIVMPLIGKRVCFSALQWCSC